MVRDGDEGGKVKGRPTRGGQRMESRKRGQQKDLDKTKTGWKVT